MGISIRRYSSSLPLLRFSLRAGIIFLLFLGMARLGRIEEELPRCRVFLVDASYSMGADWPGLWSKIVPVLKQNMDNLGRKDLACLFLYGKGVRKVFGPASRVEVSLEEFPEPDGDFRTESAMAPAMEAGTAAVPPGYWGEFLIYSDGRGASPAARKVAAELARRGGIVHTCFADASEYEEAWLEGFRFPCRVEKGEVFSLSITAAYSGFSEGKVRLSLSRAGAAEIVGERRLSLRNGEKRRISFQDQIGKPGLYRYWVKLVVEGSTDTFPENNRMAAAVRVGAGRAVLHLSEQEERGCFLHALEGLEGTTFFSAKRIPKAASLSVYDLIILDNVPSSIFQGPWEEPLEKFVKKGGGILMIGGRKGFGPGGYKGSTVEKILPLLCDPEDRNPKNILLLLDRSGSMGEGGKWEAARKAVLSLLQKMEPSDKLRFIPFSDRFHLVYGPFFPNLPDSRKDLRRILDELRPFGGTALLDALNFAALSLEESKERRSKIILVSDGKAGDGSPGEFKSLAAKFRNRKVPISIIATGRDVDEEILQILSSHTGGRFTRLQNPNQLVTSLWEELSSDLIQEKPAVVVREVDSNDELLMGTGFQEREPPSLSGWVRTGRKKEGKVLFSTAKGDPLLAVGRYGRGRTAAFTSSPFAPWAKEWGKELLLWERILQWLMGPVPVSNLSVHSNFTGQSLVLEVRGSDASLKGLELMGVLGEGEESFPLREKEPGRYRAELFSLCQGTYPVRIVRKGARETLGEANIVIPYPREFLPGPPDLSLLSDVAILGQGRFLRERNQSIPKVINNSEGMGGLSLALLLAVFLFVLDRHCPFCREQRGEGKIFIST